MNWHPVFPGHFAACFAGVDDVYYFQLFATGESKRSSFTN
jgi:hypothetical protein